ncbi:hypothetical protein, partial [Dryocola clanedunensis]
YLSKEKARQEAELAKAKAQIESVNREIADTKNKLSLYRDQLKQVKAFADHIDEQDLNHFVDVMTGQLNYAVPADYRIPKIERFSEYMSVIENSYGNKRYEGLKMMSVLGNSDGKIGLRVNRWGDGSGGYSDVTFFKTYEEAQEFVKSCAMKLLESGSLRVEELQQLKKMSIEFSDEEMLLIRQSMHSSYDKSIESLASQFNKSKEKLEADKAYIDQQLNVI